MLIRSYPEWAVNQEAKSSRFGSTLATILGVLGFVLSVVSLGWQVHVHEESLKDKALVRLSVSFYDEKSVRSATQTSKNSYDLVLASSFQKKNELSAEIVNVGQHPLYVKEVRLISPCPKTEDSDSITFQPANDSLPGVLEPGAATIYKAGHWNFLEHPLLDPGERFCVTVESNKGFLTQTNKVEYAKFHFRKPMTQTPMR